MVDECDVRPDFARAIHRANQQSLIGDQAFVNPDVSNDSLGLRLRVFGRSLDHHLIRTDVRKRVGGCYDKSLSEFLPH